MFLHFGQRLFAEYFAVLPGATDMGEHDMSVEKVSRREHFRARHSL